MPALKNEHKRLIVQRLATFVSYTEIIEELQTFGVAASMSQIAYYDPQCKNPKLGQEWRELYKETRAAFTRDTSDIAVAHKSFRLRELGRMYRKASGGARPNMMLAKELLEQAAKEVGEAYTNRRVLTAGDPLKELAALLGYTPEQLAAAIALDGAADGDGEMSVTG